MVYIDERALVYPKLRRICYSDEDPNLYRPLSRKWDSSELCACAGCEKRSFARSHSQPRRQIMFELWVKMTLHMVVACLFSAVAVLGEICQFPPDHPVQDLESGETVQTQILDHSRVYIYNDTFGNCHGCVRSVRFCYRLGSTESEGLMTIEIGNGPRATHTVTVNSTHDRANCGARYSLDFAECCVEQMLTESFVVQSPDWNYALRIFNPSSSLLRHLTETVHGQQKDLNGVPNEDPLYNPLFYFTIDTSDGRLIMYHHS